MKAAIYPGEGKPVVIEDLADPRPGPDDVIIKVARCGICGTDLSFTRGTMWDFGLNTQFGHEYAGEIIELGSNVSGWRGRRTTYFLIAGFIVVLIAYYGVNLVAPSQHRF